MGLYKLCAHPPRERDRCEHLWWGSFRGVRVSLSRWANREIHNKDEAWIALDDLRRAIRNGTLDEKGLEPPRPTSLTFREFAAIYKKRHVLAKQLATAHHIDYRLKSLVDRFGDWPLTKIKTADIEDFIADLMQPRMVNRQPNRTLAPASINRVIEQLRHMLNWAVGREYLDKTPFRRGSETLIRKLRVDNQRRRRLSVNEEANLLAVSEPFLRSMIITALDTGMRQGEMLAMQFGDIDFKRQLITLRAQTTKSRKRRTIPISTLRLKAVLEWLRLDAAGEKKSDDTLVFSNEAGERIGRFRTAWVTAVLKAHGIAPKWRSYNWTALTPDCQQQFRDINLRWHDLRHEYASRLVERGVLLAQVRDLLGHSSITTTERYDNQRLENLQLAAAKLESGKTFEAPPRTNVAPSKCQVFVKNSPDRDEEGGADRESETEVNSLDDRDLETWLGGRDSNPDTVVQSHVSYRWTTSQYWYTTEAGNSDYM